MTMTCKDPSAAEDENTGWVCVWMEAMDDTRKAILAKYPESFSTCVHACVLSCLSHVQLFVTWWTIACQASLSMGSSRQEYWSGLPCPPQGDLPDAGIKPVSLMSSALEGEFISCSYCCSHSYTRSYDLPLLKSLTASLPGPLTSLRH